MRISVTGFQPRPLEPPVLHEEEFAFSITRHYFSTELVKHLSSPDPGGLHGPD